MAALLTNGSTNKFTKQKSIPLSEKILEFFLYRFRWIFVILFILPASLLYDAYYFVRNWLIFKLQSAPKSHNRKVAVLQRQIREWNKAGRKQKLCTARAGYLNMCFRYPKYKNYMLGIKTNQLIDILEINKEERTIRVEPMVTMGQMTRFLIPLGFTLPIVPELDDLTVGGMINGCGVESSGRKYGLFQHICVSYEIITSNGELIKASKENGTKHQSLFYGIPWSHGTLGFLVAATIRIIPCKQYVRLTYHPCFTMRETCNTLRDQASRNEIEFVEGLQFSENTGCVMSGYFVDEIPKGGKLNAIGRWYKPWFFKHVEKIQSEKKDIIPFGNNPIFRYFVGWASPPKIALLKLTMPKAVKNIYDRLHVLQDLLVPATVLEQSLDFMHKKVQIYPLWLCPFNLPSQPGLVRNRSGMNKLYVDVGVYGTCKLPNYDPIDTTKAIEEHVRNVEGFQLLYADCYQTCAEFWQMFDASLYDWLRAKYDCKSAFPSVYEKVCRDARY